MPKTKATGIRRIINAAGYSWQGMKSAYQNEAAFRQELWLLLVLGPIGCYVGETLLQKAILVTSLLFVLVVELLNSAIESVVDRIGDEHHELSGRAKDMASAAVTITLIMVVIVWGSILLA
ncbi:MAG: diacylglycerol kinase [Pseudomonadales bacterium]|nr:diacylglycerol kinase [Pseudomonadales bacterium]